MTDKTRAYDLGEFGLIGRIRELFPEIDLTDDCALIKTPESSEMILTIDAGIRGTHFPADSKFMLDAGWRTMAGAVSDINASGGIAISALLALQIPEDFLLADFDDFIRGVRTFVDWSNVPLHGGNITRGKDFSATVSVIGSVKKYIGRNGAKAEQILFVSGTVGGSEAGRMIAVGEIDSKSISSEICNELISRYMRPSPTLGLGEKLAGIGVSSMIDISDGLLADTAHIAKTSGGGIIIDLDKLPLHPGLVKLAKILNIDSAQIAPISGEEFELIGTMPAENFAHARKIALEMDSDLTIIGKTTSKTGIQIIREGRRVDFDYMGWRHF